MEDGGGGLKQLLGSKSLQFGQHGEKVAADGDERKKTAVYLSA